MSQLEIEVMSQICESIQIGLFMHQIPKILKEGEIHICKKLQVSLRKCLTSLVKQIYICRRLSWTFSKLWKFSRVRKEMMVFVVNFKNNNFRASTNPTYFYYLVPGKALFFLFLQLIENNFKILCPGIFKYFIFYWSSKHHFLSQSLWHLWHHILIQ